MSEQIPGNIVEAGKKAAELAGVAGDVQSGMYTIGDILKKKITEAYGYNKDIIQNLDEAVRNYFSSPSEARVKYQNIFNPFQRENLVSQYVSNKSLPMLSQANVLGARMGGISDLVGSAVGGYQAMAAREQARANAARQTYQDLLDQYKLEQDLNAVTSSEMEIMGRRYLVTLNRKGEIINKVDLGPAKSSGDSSQSYQSAWVPKTSTANKQLDSGFQYAPADSYILEDTQTSGTGDNTSQPQGFWQKAANFFGIY